MRRSVFILSLLFAAQVIFAQDDAANKKVEEALRTKKVTLNFQDTTLTEVMSFLHEITGLDFVLDPKLEKASETTVTLRVNDISLENALSLILESHGLAFCVKDGAVFISTKEKIAEILGKVAKPEGEVKPGEVLFLLTDSSRVKGAIKITELQLKTAYGTLTIPIKDILGIRFPAAGKEEGKESQQPTEDEVKTVKFTVTGNLQVEKFELETSGGVLTIKKADIVEIIFQPSASAALGPGKKEWETAAAGTLRTIMTTAEVFRIKFGDYPMSETSARNATGKDRLMFRGTQNCSNIDLSAAQSYTFKYTRIDASRWNCTADTDRTNLNDFYIDESGVLHAAPSTGDGSQAGPESEPYGG